MASGVSGGLLAEASPSELGRPGERALRNLEELVPQMRTCTSPRPRPPGVSPLSFCSEATC